MKLFILILVLFIAMVYYLKTYTTVLDTSEKYSGTNENVPSKIPPDWTLDWDGGHGKSRHDIMMEPGPYFDPEKINN